MDRPEYDKLDRVEDRMWWFAAAHANLLTSYARTTHATGTRPLLDAGCGTGGLLAKLAARYPDRRVLGLDADRQACTRARAKSACPLCVGSVDALPFADAAFAAIFSADVLCHRDVDERRALRQFHRCLADEGILVLNLPAYRWMLSRHDAAVDNIRRYTRAGIAALLRAAGFRTIHTSYWNMILFPLMVVTRKLLPARAGAASDVRLRPRPVEALCRVATRVEHLLIRRGFTLPYGGSVLAIAVKQGTVHG